MKKAIYRVAITALIAGAIFASCNNNGSKEQADGKDTSQTSSGKTKLDKSKVPKPITDLFYADYPVTTYTDWYGYPAYDYDNDWYYNDPYQYSNDYPETYVVEFAADSTPYKAVYTKAGKKVAIHKTISDLPTTITSAISQGNYKTWTLGSDKEEIFKDKDTDQLKVYKVNVEMGGEKHTLYFQPDGELLKDKKVS